MSAETSETGKTADPDAGSDAATAPAEKAQKSQRRRQFLGALGSLQGYIGLVLIIAIGIATKGQIFWNQENLTNAIGAFASRGILAVGATMVILTAGIDLSVGSILGLGSMVSALMLVDHNLHPILILLISMGVGALCGLANGIGVTWFRVQSFVMTLATLTIVRGIDRQLSDNVSVGTQVANDAGKLTPRAEQFQGFGTPGNNILTGWHIPGLGDGIYYPILALVIAVVVCQLILSKTRLGRHIYAVGGNPTAARLSGVNVTLVVISVFTISGILAGFAGPIDAAYSASADPLAGQSYELDAIAAAVIGGASLNGGKGNVIGTLVGALILTLLDNVLGLNAISDNAQLIIKGLIVIVAVIIQRPDFFRSLVSGLRRLQPASR